ncbi:MAG: diacylglycerol kinase family lipid kinase, partial [Abditibacteriales bacterium]|nr:diacylglycerol kinase family lipid kinase [Abditibacteriales bacterium]MDW8368475.1 diacylglycerol kinase family lipid kinase [Abditibacteriales bacterium]
MRVLLIVNPTAGQGRAARALPTMVRCLRGDGATCEVFETTRPGEAQAQARQAAQAGYDLVVAAGGDGTIHEVVNGVVGSAAVLGVIPVGTENIFGKEFNLPFDVEAACRLIRCQPAQTLDVGLCHAATVKRYFLLMAGLGFDAQVVRAVPPPLKQRLKSFAFFLTGCVTFARFQPMSVTITTEDRALTARAWEVLVSNAKNFGWRVRISPTVSMNDGLFDVCVFTQPHRWGFAVEALGSLAQRMVGGSGV